MKEYEYFLPEIIKEESVMNKCVSLELWASGRMMMAHRVD